MNIKSSTPSDVTTLTANLDAIIEFDAPIGQQRTWYGVGGRADVFVRPRSHEALVKLAQRCHETGTPLRVLGSGANLLIADEGVDGVVVHLDQSAFRESSTIHRHRPERADAQGLAENGLRIMAGESMERLVMSTALQGMSGLEMMAGIPATIGGAVRMNAGGRFGSIGDAITAVGTLDVKGRTVVYRRDAIEFGYRRCSIVDPIILWVEVALKPEDPTVAHERVKEYFAYKKGSQPMADRSAGCVFQNPLDPEHTAGRLSAGELIDRAGLKGTTHGGAQISVKHANFFPAKPGSRASDVIALMELARERVLEQTGIELHRELVIWQRRSAKPDSNRSES